MHARACDRPYHSGVLLIYNVFLLVLRLQTKKVLRVMQQTGIYEDDDVVRHCLYSSLPFVLIHARALRLSLRPTCTLLALA